MAATMRTTSLSKTTIGMRMGHLSAFYQRIIEWDYPDIPPGRRSTRRTGRSRTSRCRGSSTTAPPRSSSPRPATCPTSSIVSASSALAHGHAQGRLLGLTVDSVVQIGSAYWLRIPIGKLHNDRYVPLHPQLKTMIDAWLTHRPDWQDSPLLFTDRGWPIPGTLVDMVVQSASAAAGIGHVHPHQLRHALATQAINRGMSLEAIAALLGHKAMTMTMVYANPRELHQTGAFPQVA
ncbi:tyrosine-type recombinase/integrase [Rhodococcus sp. NPDC056960]